MLKAATLSPPKAALALVLGGAIATGSLFLVEEPHRLPTLVLVFALSWATVVDIDRHVLPDIISLPLIAVGLAMASLAGWPDLIDSITGAIVGYGSLVLLAHAYRRIRNRDGLGRGDAKFFAAAGAWLGLTSLPAVMLVASFAALGFVGLRVILRRPLLRDEPIAFGPFLAVGMCLAWLLRATGRI